MKKDITYEITEHIGVFDDANETWIGQVNRVSWNGNAPKIDIRYWKINEPEKNRKVGSLSNEAAIALGELLLKANK